MRLRIIDKARQVGAYFGRPRAGGAGMAYNMRSIVRKLRSLMA